MPTNDGVQLVRGSGAEGGAEGGSRREFVPFARFSVLSGLGGPGWGGSHACFAPYCARDVVLETGCKFGRPVSASAAVISDHNEEEALPRPLRPHQPPAMRTNSAASA